VTTVAAVTRLADAVTIVRLSLHVLAAAVWVGGQFVLGGLIPTVRDLGEGATQKVARAFARLSWPAFGVLLATGVWNAAVAGRHVTGAWSVVFGIKMATVVVAGATSWMHTRATTPRTRGVYAGVAALSSTAALVLGVALAG
jgi:putative copper export protein